MDKAFLKELTQLVTQYRSQCLWFLRSDYMPSNEADILRILRHIEKHADREGYKKARDLREWLLRISSGKSVG